MTKAAYHPVFGSLSRSVNCDDDTPYPPVRIYAFFIIPGKRGYASMVIWLLIDGFNLVELSVITIVCRRATAAARGRAA